MRAGAGPPGAAVVVGGGFVGLSSALALQRAGAGRVRLLERAPGDPRRAASHGNAGTFAPYANVPVNAPGAASAALAMLARPGGGALGMRLTPHLLRMVPWALGFWRHSDPGRWRASGLALGSLLRRATAGYDGVLAQAGVPPARARGLPCEDERIAFFSRFEIRGLFVELSPESQLIRSGLNPFRINPK